MKFFHTNAITGNQAHLVSDDFYDEISRDWQLRARKLQDRRWRALKHHMHEER